MIIKTWYYPIEMFRKLKRIKNGEVVGTCAIGISFGNRTAGKTVGIGWTILKEYMEGKRGKCLILCRTIKEKEGTDDNGGKAIENFWLKVLSTKDVLGYYKCMDGHSYEFKGTSLYIDGEIFCRSGALSESWKIKEQQFVGYDTIVMDECVRNGESNPTILGMSYWKRFLMIVQTVARNREKALDDTVAIFIANIDCRDNWIFNNLGINKHIRMDTKKLTRDNYYLEIVNNPHSKEKLDKSSWGEIMALSDEGMEYSNQSNSNEFGDNLAFVIRKGLDFSKLVNQIIVDGKILGIFSNDDCLHVSVLQNTSNKVRVNTLDCYHHTEEVRLQVEAPYISRYMRAYVMDGVTFQTLESKLLFLKLIGF